MSAEHHHDSAERQHNAEDLETARAEQLEKLRTSPETDNPDERLEAAREALKEHHDKVPEPAAAAAESDSGTIKIPFLDRKLNYVQTLASVQRQLSPIGRSFSKIIHVPVVEKTSEALEKTVARPSIMLGATWTALIVGSIFFFTARHYGYPLAGSELLFSLIVGAGLGVIIEMLWRASRHH